MKYNLLLSLFNTDVRSDIGHRLNRQNFDATVKQRHLISKQDIANIKRKVVDSSIMRHADDATSVNLLVNELRGEPYDPVLLYKPQHTTSPEFVAIPRDVFILAIQTQWQKEVYGKHASTILCMDSTHGTNAYQFKVITCIVPDEFGKGEKQLTEGYILQLNLN